MPAHNTSVRFLAVHLGASNSSGAKDSSQKDIAKRVCQTVMKQSAKVGDTLSNEILIKAQTFTCDSSTCQTLDPCQYASATSYLMAEEAVVMAVELMENERSLNCGYGSNLNMQGQVECDASLMSGRNHIWTGIGAVSGCKNPIKLAKSLHDHASIKRPFGLVQPNFLVTSGARQWMREHCRDLLIPESHLISSRALSKYQSSKSNYDNSLRREQSMNERIDPDGPNKQKRVEQLGVERAEKSIEDNRLDTVGAIAVDHENNIACAISSGGIMLKHRGRIGQAGLPGAGCWSQDSMAVTTTGVGEYLTTSLFAKKLYEKVQTLKLIHDLTRTSADGRMSAHASELDWELMLSEALNQCFLDLADSPALRHVPVSSRSAGLIAVSSFPLVEIDPPPPSRDRHHEGAFIAAYHQRQRQAGGSGSANDDGRREGAINGELPPDLYLSYGHNTRSLCIGYMRANDTEAVSFVSRSAGGDGGSCASSLSGGVMIRTLKVGHCFSEEKHEQQ